MSNNVINLRNELVNSIFNDSSFLLLEKFTNKNYKFIKIGKKLQNTLILLIAKKKYKNAILTLHQLRLL